MEKDFKGIDHGTGQIDLREQSMGTQLIEMKPIEIHHKADGSLTDGPVLAILMEHPLLKACGQLSIEMMNEGLADIGYEVRKKENQDLIDLGREASKTSGSKAYVPQMSEEKKTHIVQQADNADELFEAFEKIVEAQGSRKTYSAERLKEKYLMLRALVMSSKEMSKVPFNLITRTHGIRAKTMELLYYELHGI